MPESRTLVTGALGCLGAWTIRALLDEGDAPVGLDVGEDDARLRLVLGGDRDRVPVVNADVSDAAALGRVLDEHEIERIVHLAALQVPSCRANPALGARVNVLGTVAVFEAVKERRERIRGLAYASSTAVYSADDPSPAPEAGGTRPTTLYGVYKLANEGTARIYWADEEIASIGIRPYVVYGPGRDQGLTSGPSVAMAAAARGEGHEIGYGSVVQYDFAPDVGRAFARAAAAATEGAHVANFPGEARTMAEVVEAIEAAAPAVAGRVTWRDDPLPFPERLEATLLERLLGPLGTTPFEDGVRRTVSAAAA